MQQVRQLDVSGSSTGLSAATWRFSAAAMPLPRACMSELTFDIVVAAVDRMKAGREGQSDSEESAHEEAPREQLHSKSAKFFSKMSISKQKEGKGK